jgi:hypothetical protein
MAPQFQFIKEPILRTAVSCAKATEEARQKEKAVYVCPSYA